MKLVENSVVSVKQLARNVIPNQIECVKKSPVINAFFEANLGLLVVLNEDGKIVRLNDSFIASLGISNHASVMGLKLCEAMNCVHASHLQYGFGTTSHCMACGAAIVIMAAIKDHQVSEKICAFTLKKDGVTLERSLSVRAQPLIIDNNRWILIFAQDITHHNCRLMLEQIYYHDINNILTALTGNCEMLVREMPDQHRSLHILNAANRLCSEVAFMHFLSNQKEVVNPLKKCLVSVSEINDEVKLIVYGHPKFDSRNLEQICPNEEIKIHTDIDLVTRILGNMLLNAVEATVEGGTVRLTTLVKDTDIMWEVWNEAHIPSEVQPRIFQKHFSTKASMGRGMGTHSMKILGEKYLDGYVTFSSTFEGGTTFCFKHPLKQV